jgi:hypothetical protein
VDKKILAIIREKEKKRERKGDEEREREVRKEIY